MNMNNEERRMVIHPGHYNANGKRECWDEMIDRFGEDAVVIFDCLSAYKYGYRKGLKAGNSVAQENGKIENYLCHAEKLLYNVSSDSVAHLIYSIVNNELREK